MVTRSAIPSVGEFDRLATLPENRHRLLELEYIGGEVVAVVSNTKSSRRGVRTAGCIELFATDHDSGFVTGADGGETLRGFTLKLSDLFAGVE